jgi:hypothetical protein
VATFATVVGVIGQEEPVTGLDVVRKPGAALGEFRVESGDLRVAVLVAEVAAGDVPHPVSARYLVDQVLGGAVGG